MPFRQIYPVVKRDAGNTAKVDIFAVHGLNPRSKSDSDHAWDTWRTPPGPGGRLWLSGDLPSDIPDARIFLYEYNSTVVYGRDRDTFVGKANEMLEAIRVERDDVEGRPILLLGHSLGGLLIKQALINAHNNPHYTAIKNATRGLAFFATPHNGGDWKLLSLGTVAAKIALATGFQQGDDVLETLKHGSIFSDLMDELFRQQLMEYNIISFWGAFDDVVPRKSARLGLPGDRENVVKLNADHSGVCKFGTTQTDQDNLKFVLRNIKDLYKIALRRLAPTPATASPDWDSGQHAGFNGTTFPPPPPLVSDFLKPQPPPLPPRSASSSSGGVTSETARGGVRCITGLMYPPTSTDAKSKEAADHKNSGRWEQARQLAHQQFSEHTRALGETHLETLTAAYDYTETTFSLGYLGDATRWADWVFETGRSVLGSTHPLVLKVSRIKGEIWTIRGQYAEAEDILSATLVEQQDAPNIGTDHPDTFETERALAQACQAMDRTDEAVKRLQRRLDTMTRCLGESHIKVCAATVDLLAAKLSYSWIPRNKLQETAREVEDLLQRLKESVGLRNQVTIGALRVWGHVKILEDRTIEAIDALRRALSHAEALLGRDHPETGKVVGLMVMLHTRRGRSSSNLYGTPAMLAWCDRYATWLEQRMGLDIPETRSVLTILAGFYSIQHENAKAAEYYERLVRSYQGVNSREAREANMRYEICRRYLG